MRKPDTNRMLAQALVSEGCCSTVQDAQRELDHAVDHWLSASRLASTFGASASLATRVEKWVKQRRSALKLRVHGADSR